MIKVVAGAGLSGCTIARNLADKGHKVIVVEKEQEIGGLLQDREFNNAYYHLKGPHVLHTNKDEVFDYIKRFTDVVDLPLVIEAQIQDKITYNPFNFHTIDTFYNKEKADKLKTRLRETYGEETTIVKMLNSDDELIREYANFLYEEDYKQYTSKQWGIDPEEVDKSVLERVPVRFNYDKVFKDEKYIFVPDKGYSNMLKEMLNHENISLMLNTNIKHHITIKNNQIFFDDKLCELIYTGPIDNFFDFEYGKLPYRSTYFHFEKNNNLKQTSPVRVYPNLKYKYTRTTDFAQFYKQEPGDLICYEYPQESDFFSELCYPVLTDESKKIDSLYKEKADKIDNLYLFGRLAEFKYYDMDTIIEKSIEFSRRF